MIRRMPIGARAHPANGVALALGACSRARRLWMRLSFRATPSDPERQRGKSRCHSERSPGGAVEEHVIPSGAAKRRSRGIATNPTEGPLYRDNLDSSATSGEIPRCLWQFDAEVKPVRVGTGHMRMSTCRSPRDPTRQCPNEEDEQGSIERRKES